jgi:hypothetical protein
VGSITEAYAKGARDEDIMRHTRHRDLRTMRGYVQRAGLELAKQGEVALEARHGGNRHACEMVETPALRKRGFSV